MRTTQRTLFPRTNSGNTVPVAGFEAGPNSIRATVNAWIRSGGGGLIDKVIDFCPVVETGFNSGFWRPASTADGVHPLVAREIEMGALYTPTEILTLAA